ncbi:hypothetical protein J4425_02640 [Candidatus Woesearchaeota archaeon]|nr:hypothetical protein [Candidatus Woesearchaeota archaeon]
MFLTASSGSRSVSKRELKNYDAIGKNNRKLKFTMASSPVIHVDNKVLLVEHWNDELWKFPRGNSMVFTF